MSRSTTLKTLTYKVKAPIPLIVPYIVNFVKQPLTSIIIPKKKKEVFSSVDFSFFNKNPYMLYFEQIGG